MGIAGINIVAADTPTNAMTGNPAGLASQDGAVQGTVVITGYSGEFSNVANTNSPLRNPVTPYGSAAATYRLEDNPDITLGMSLAPDALARGYWRFNDSGATNYGYTDHDSRLITYRLAFGAGWQATEDFAIGATAGVTYNDNYLKAPYTFQNAGALTGAKVLLDLETDGFGPSFSLGANYDVTKWASIGFRYMSPTWLYTDGSATGTNPGTGAFSYDAKVDQQLPQRIGVALAVEPTDWLSLFFQADWVDYAGAYDTLNIELTNGSNPGGPLPAAFNETSPLSWESVWVFAMGAEVDITDDLVWSVGYTYGESPVPDSTLTPMTAAITEQTVTTGLSYRWDSIEVAIAYQYDIPNTQSTNSSILLSGEYQNSSTKLEGHTGAVSLTWYY